MNTRELIAALQAMPQDATVECAFEFTSSEVTNVEALTARRDGKYVVIVFLGLYDDE